MNKNAIGVDVPSALKQFCHSELRTAKEVAELRDQISSSMGSASKSSMNAESEEESKSAEIPAPSKVAVIQNPENESQT
jgi:hypothetical protein